MPAMTWGWPFGPSTCPRPSTTIFRFPRAFQPSGSRPRCEVGAKIVMTFMEDDVPMSQNWFVVVTMGARRGT